MPPTPYACAWQMDFDGIRSVSFESPVEAAVYYAEYRDGIDNRNESKGWIPNPS